MGFQKFNPDGKCPKCGHDDVATGYVVNSGRYGDPCYDLPRATREGEHLHRHCRRCSFEWCEACIDPEHEAPRSTAVDETLEPTSETINTEIARVKKELTDLRHIAYVLTDGNLLYRFHKYAAAYQKILSHYARFKIGDHVQLASTPVITEQNAPGWMSSKHFLVKGARGVVISSDFWESGNIMYGIRFDDESWRDLSGNIMLVEPSNRHSYTFRESVLEPLGA